jgi:hypothetical protein
MLGATAGGALVEEPQVVVGLLEGDGADFEGEELDLELELPELRLPLLNELRELLPELREAPKMSCVNNAEMAKTRISP